jgi:hypothetical protein
MDTSRPPWITERFALDNPPQLPAIPVLPLPMQLVPPPFTEPPLPPPLPPSESTSNPAALLLPAELQPVKSLSRPPRPSLDARPSTYDTVPTLPLSRKSLEATNLLVKPTVSPQQAASLGRSSQPPKRTDTSPTGSYLRTSFVSLFPDEGEADGKVPRRNSLSDLRIPARITQAQSGLRRDLTLVKEFAKKVERESHPGIDLSSVI